MKPMFTKEIERINPVLSNDDNMIVRVAKEKYVRDNWHELKDVMDGRGRMPLWIACRTMNPNDTPHHELLEASLERRVENERSR